MAVGDQRFLTRSLTVLITLGFTLFMAVSAYCQVTGATLSGTVTDASGAAIPGAQVSVRNAATGVTRDFTTDSAGFYTAPNITAGTYEVRVSAKGFSTAVQPNVVLGVGAQQLLNFSMKVGQTSQTIEVTTQAPQVQLTSSALSGEVASATVRELPLNGRDWTQLAALQPGVARIETQVSYDDAGRGTRGFGAELTISGGRSTFANYRIDGISVVDYANATPGSVIGGTLGVDAIQEFSVLTGGFSAEYGRASSGVVNAISKSGTNSFHGDVYEFLRNSSLDSNDYFDRAAGHPRPPFRRNQFGGSAGGPIIKDKTFIFGDYEGLRQAKGIPSSITVPSDAARAAATNAYTVSLLALYPHATGPTSDPNVGRFVFSGLQIVPENFYTARVDHRIGANDTLFGTYLHDDTDYTQPDKMNDVLVNSHTTRQTVAIEESHTFSSSFVNAARIGYNRNHVLNVFTPSAINPAAADTNLGTMPGQTAPRVAVNGISGFFGGVNSATHGIHAWNSYQAYDDAFWTHGTHSIKFGVGVEWMRYNLESFQNPGGQWRFGSLSNFLQGIGDSYEAGLPQAITPREFRQTLVGGYLQDDWRFRSNLTLNLGLRYEMTTVLKDGLGKFASLVSIAEPSTTTTADANLRCGTQFDAAATYGVPPQPGTTCDSVGPYYSNPTLRNFEPRIGFAWDPFRNGKTSVRGGFGIYDVQPLPGYFILQANQAAPFMIFKSTKAVSGKFAAGNGQNLLLNPAALAPLSASTIETNPHRSYVMQWNFNIQRQIVPDLTLTLGYVGSHAVHLLFRGDDGNMTGTGLAGTPSVQLTSAGYLFPCGYPTIAGAPNGPTSCTPGFTGGVNGTATTPPGGGANAQVNQALGVIRYIYWNSDSNYHALNVNLQKTLTHGVQFQVAYSFAKSLDDSSQTIAGDTFGNGLNAPFWFLPKVFRGPSDFNVTHTMSINGLWDIPTPKSLGGFARTALGGWELGSIFAINSGVPTTPIIGGDPLGLGNSGTDQFSLPNRVPGCDPILHGYAGSAPGSPNWINPNCFTLPMVSASSPLAAQCGDFSQASHAPPALPSGMVYCANLLGNVGRNSLYGPRFVNLDFSILKNFPVKSLSEAFNIQFRAEFFDITNHDNFVPPQPGSGDGNAALFNTDGSSTGAGQITLFANGQQPAREIQFAIKVNW